jgi:hypothetical protein
MFHISCTSKHNVLYFIIVHVLAFWLFIINKAQQAKIYIYANIKLLKTNAAIRFNKIYVHFLYFSFFSASFCVTFVPAGLCHVYQYACYLISFLIISPGLLPVIYLCAPSDSITLSHLHVHILPCLRRICPSFRCLVLGISNNVNVQELHLLLLLLLLYTVPSLTFISKLLGSSHLSGKALQYNGVSYVQSY